MVTVFEGNATPHCVAVVADPRARANARESAGEGSLCGFIGCALVLQFLVGGLEEGQRKIVGEGGDVNGVV